MLKTTAKLYGKRCLAEQSQFRLAGVGKRLTGTRCSLCFLDLQNRKKNSCPQHEIIKKKEHHGIATKMNQKKRLKCAETSCLMHSVSKTLFTNVNASTRGFRSGGLFMASPLPHFGRIIHSSTRDFGRDFWCQKKLFRHRPSYRILELTDICVCMFPRYAND